MIAGRVTPHRTAAVRLTVIGIRANEIDFDAIVDTGFSGYLTLPRRAIETLHLPFRNVVVSTVGDGREIESLTYSATVRWNGEQRPILVLAMETPPLLGMSLLYGSHLAMDVVDGGQIAISPLR